ncbi:geranylgeranylglycerol-phosphate geranylgeranyltransferase [Postechiella marina]|uniref:Geranylgeranylglycerol-phosphate geranylgeranyltransferase n=2 Tax=Postechiella marina TaxID=943941 RepID=A0ABP8CC38_9FLAO
MIALMQYLIKYALLEPFGVASALNAFSFSLLTIATICIAAAGNVINDIYDVETDFVNKPDKIIIDKHITEKTAYNMFIALNAIGVSAGFYVSLQVNRSSFFALFVIISALLYIYATYLKRSLLIGNIVISVLVSLSIIIVGIFDLIPAITTQNRSTQFVFFKILMDYTYFAFIINLIREIAKDIEDINGDYKSGMNTLPIAIGRNRAHKILFGLSIIPLFTTIYYITNTLYKNEIAVIYFLIFIVAPLFYLCIKIYTAKTTLDYKHISNILKLVMLFGMLSLLLYKYILL